MAGILPEDAPDPRVEQAEQLKFMPIPVMGLVPQPSLEDADSIGLAYGQDNRGYSDMSVSVTYALWRNPMTAPLRSTSQNSVRRCVGRSSLFRHGRGPRGWSKGWSGCATPSCGRPCEPPGTVTRPSFLQSTDCWSITSTTFL